MPLLELAESSDRIVITNDKDFGTYVYRHGHRHQGVILLRLEDERSANKIRVLRVLLGEYADRLSGSFVVVTEKQIRFAQRQ